MFQDNKSFIIQIKNVLCHDYVNAYKDTKLDHSKFLDPIVKYMYKYFSSVTKFQVSLVRICQYTDNALYTLFPSRK